MGVNVTTIKNRCVCVLFEIGTLKISTTNRIFDDYMSLTVIKRNPQYILKNVLIIKCRKDNDRKSVELRYGNLCYPYEALIQH